MKVAVVPVEVVQPFKVGLSDRIYDFGQLKDCG